jgi:chorismate-pyruvate lyase
VSRALEAHTLLPVAVETVEQVATTTSGLNARYLAGAEGEECVRRRVVITIAGREPSVWAESYLIPKRLPPEFLPVLGDSPQGIGGSLQQIGLESWRELLWFGLGEQPAWSPGGAPGGPVLWRFYRVITGGLPALLISEAFATEMRGGVYRLSGSEERNASGGPCADESVGGG